MPTWVGWVGMFFDLGFIGLLSIVLVPLAIGLVRIRREEGEGDEPTGLEQARAWWARYRANRVLLPISLPRRRR